MIGGGVDPKTRTLTLLRGDLRSLIVPFALFPQSGDGTTPHFSKLRFTDYGSTVALGDYEAASDAILDALDPGFHHLLKN